MRVEWDFFSIVKECFALVLSDQMIWVFAKAWKVEWKVPGF